MDRIVPPRRDRPVTFTLPKIQGPADAATAMGAVLEAAAQGDLTPIEAGEFAKLLDDRQTVRVTTGDPSGSTSTRESRLATPTI
jgi:hypothetical protein